MTYTIEELQRMLDDDTMIGGYVESSMALQLASQLLATMREHARLQSRIDAAAAIAANVPATGAIVDYVYSNGWNECREQFRKALEVEGE